MKLTAYHDETGMLVALSASPKGAPPSRMELRRAPTRSEIDAPGLPDDANPAAIEEYLSKAVASSRVEIHQGKARLVDS